ncbi:hypothetical protein FKP32DRAFT_943254 [Trametes sanguinea]|nr:hypothetical protein FKP32DRAFT_943254 [Trametes sanguinea]
MSRRPCVTHRGRRIQYDAHLTAVLVRTTKTRSLSVYRYPHDRQRRDAGRECGAWIWRNPSAVPGSERTGTRMRSGSSSLGLLQLQYTIERARRRYAMATTRRYRPSASTTVSVVVLIRQQMVRSHVKRAYQLEVQDAIYYVCCLRMLALITTTARPLSHSEGQTHAPILIASWLTPGAAAGDPLCIMHTSARSCIGPSDECGDGARRVGRRSGGLLQGLANGRACDPLVLLVGRAVRVTPAAGVTGW